MVKCAHYQESLTIVGLPYSAYHVSIKSHMDANRQRKKQTSEQAKQSVSSAEGRNQVKLRGAVSQTLDSYFCHKIRCCIRSVSR